MLKKGSKYIILAMVTLGALMLLQYNQPKNINWYPSYVATHKIPYGTYVFNTLLSKKFSGKVQDVRVPPFEFLNRQTEAHGTYLFVNNDIAFEKAELNELLNWTAKGNTVFIASENFEERLLDTLKLSTGYIYGGFEESQAQRLSWVNPLLKTSEPSYFDRASYSPFFDQVDTLNTTILGTLTTEKPQDQEQDSFTTNVIRQPFGKGNIILSTFPEAFTNYFILQDKNSSYTAGLFSYLDGPGTIYVDHHHKSGKSFYTSPMYIFLNTEELRWAYYLALIGVLIYIIFEGKRKQRAIPVILPLKNQTLAFTRTIADMYFEKSDHKNITEHRINYFLEELRSMYYLGNIDHEEAFYKNLALRSGNTVEWVSEFFHFMEKLRNADHVTDQELLQLNAYIEKFKAEKYGGK
jgi:hypothetical protein